MSRTGFIAEELAALSARDRLRRVRVVEARAGMEVVVDGRRLINFASNDYLGLAMEPRLAAASARAEHELGVGAGASRLVSGHTAVTEELEAYLRSWLDVGSVRVMNSGYAANTGVIPTLVGRDDLVLSDERNHASLIDGCRLSRAEVSIYRHANLAELEVKLRRPARRKLVVTESIFSMDGDLAPLAELVEVAHAAGAMVLVDDAHAFGIAGEGGVGFGLAAGADVVVATLGKALGSAGAFVAGPPGLADLLWNRARPLVFSTGLTVGAQAAALEAARIVSGGEGPVLRGALAARRHRLTGNAAYLGAIVPVVIGADGAAVAVAAALEKRGFWIPAIRPPTVAEGTARLRVTLSARHTEQQVADLATALRAAGLRAGPG